MATRPALDIDHIVGAARTLIDEDGLGRLSMRRLGERLGVDPMAVYRHVENKQALLALVMGRILADMPPTDDSQPWSERVRSWAVAYWDLAADNRELVAAALGDPAIAEGALPAMEPLTEALTCSGLDPDLVEPNAYLIVDFVHGSALGTADHHRAEHDAADALRTWFDIGLTTVIAGIDQLTRTAEQLV